MDYASAVQSGKKRKHHKSVGTAGPRVLRAMPPRRLLPSSEVILHSVERQDLDAALLKWTSSASINKINVKQFHNLAISDLTVIVFLLLNHFCSIEYPEEGRSSRNRTLMIDVPIIGQHRGGQKGAVALANLVTGKLAQVKSGIKKDVSAFMQKVVQPPRNAGAGPPGVGGALVMHHTMRTKDSLLL